MLPSGTLQASAYGHVAREPLSFARQTRVPRFGEAASDGKPPENVADDQQPVLSIRDLKIVTPDGRGKILRGVDLDVMPGEILGIVGESGCGKSTVLNGVMRVPGLGDQRKSKGSPLYHALVKLLGLNNASEGSWKERLHGYLKAKWGPEPVLPFRLSSGLYVQGGEITYNGENILALPDEEFSRRFRSSELAMIFQNPSEALNPLHKIGKQIGEVLRESGDYAESEIDAKIRELLELVNMPDIDLALDKYPHKFSGGQLQRVCIAMALAGSPKLILADEPTTALDVSVQEVILREFKRVMKDTGTTIMFVTHNLAVVQSICDRVAVMYGGKVVEVAPVKEFFTNPKHPYSKKLRAAMPVQGKSLHELDVLEGQPPNPYEAQTGCPFAERCPSREKIAENADGDVCYRLAPVLAQLDPDSEDDHSVACLESEHSWPEESRKEGNASGEAQ